MNYENLTKETLPVEFQNRIERFNRLFSAATDHSFEEDDLFEYEMLCIKQALSFSEFFQDFGDEQYQDFLKQYESLIISLWSSLLASCRLTDVFKKEKMASRMLF